jgi:hypothetical protein
MKEASDFESSVFENLRNALSFVCKGFVDISRKQDLLCSEYKSQAANIVGQMVQQDASGYVKSPIQKDTVLGQSAIDAEVNIIF